MFGSLGWGLAMFFMGIALDNSTSFTTHPCAPLKLERNYTICFATFSVLMGAALLTATQIKYPVNINVSVLLCLVNSFINKKKLIKSLM